MTSGFKQSLSKTSGYLVPFLLAQCILGTYGLFLSRHRLFPAAGLRLQCDIGDPGDPFSMHRGPWSFSCDRVSTLWYPRCRAQGYNPCPIEASPLSCCGAPAPMRHRRSTRSLSYISSPVDSFLRPVWHTTLWDPWSHYALDNDQLCNYG